MRANPLFLARYRDQTLVEIHLVSADEIYFSKCRTDLPYTAAFALSSGTVGAALSSSLSKIRSIALSYGTVVHPTPKTFFNPAHALGCRIISHLWNNWGTDKDGLRKGEVDSYNVNIPMIESLLSEEEMPIYWTKMWRSSYGRLFKDVSVSDEVRMPSGGPDSDLSAKGVDASPSSLEEPKQDSNKLIFKFSPDFGPLIRPPVALVPEGTDAWAINNGWASVTPLQAKYAEPADEEHPGVQQGMLKLRL
jgi:tubulin---tyrosine ligase